MEMIEQAIILADGRVGSRAELDAAWPDWCSPNPYVVAADGGARHAAGLDLRIDRWVGDGDSLGEEGIAALEAAGVPVDRAPIDKDESDTELALRAALEQGPAAVVVLGALGGPRLDHALANLALLTLPELRGVDVRLVAVDSRIRLLEAADGPASVELVGRVGDLVTLLPVGTDASGVTTSGLAFPLRGETLLVGRSRGLSNRRIDSAAIVRVEAGRLLLAETPATL
jgi:thiamine pyrophosphokinase